MQEPSRQEKGKNEMANLNKAHEQLSKQRDYVKRRHLEGQKSAALTGGTTGLVDERMLAQSMRSVRYADEAHAAGDIIDNAIEAGATQVHLVYHLVGDKIAEVAFVDDGSGIDEGFLPHATKWGGSSNDGTRNTFGRFGFGLPSASVNRGTKFSVYSRTDSGEPFAKVSVDLKELKIEGTAVPLPVVTHGDLPAWVTEYLEDSKSGFAGGPTEARTVVVWSDLDKLIWKNRQQSSSRFREHLGITYAGWLDVCKIFVHGAEVLPVDVLFTTPGSRWYDIDGYSKAESQSPVKFEIADESGTRHEVTIRMSLLRKDAYKALVPAEGKGPATLIRQKVRTVYNGFFVTRNGRFIEVANPTDFTWDNYARQVGIAIDFPPELDEVFGVTPDKQTIIFTERLEKLLKDHGIKRAFDSLKADVRQEREKTEREADADGPGGERPSEVVIAKALEGNYRKTRKASKETQEEAQRNLRDKAKKAAAETGLPEEEIAKAQEKAAQAKPYHIEFEPGAEDDPFYTPMMVGPQLVVRVNTKHPWYREVYAKLKDDQRELRSSLELMLFVLSASELDATTEGRIFYRGERRQWSQLLADAFDLHPLVFHKAGSREELDADDPTPWQVDENEAEAS